VRRRTRRILIALGAVLALVVAGAGYYASASGEILAGYAAKTLCTCVFVAGREAASCLEQELGAYRSLMTATIDRDRRAVDTRALFVRRARASFRDGQGCALH
jgi:hypothetical protein